MGVRNGRGERGKGHENILGQACCCENAGAICRGTRVPEYQSQQLHRKQRQRQWPHPACRHYRRLQTQSAQKLRRVDVELAKNDAGPSICMPSPAHTTHVGDAFVDDRQSRSYSIPHGGLRAWRRVNKQPQKAKKKKNKRQKKKTNRHNATWSIQYSNSAALLVGVVDVRCGHALVL